MGKSGSDNRQQPAVSLADLSQRPAQAQPVVAASEAPVTRQESEDDIFNKDKKCVTRMRESLGPDCCPLQTCFQ